MRKGKEKKKGQAEISTAFFFLLSFLLSIGLIKEEDPLLGRSWQPCPFPFDAKVLNHGTDANEHAKGHDQPPQPIVVVGRQIGGMFDDEGPFGQAQAETGQSAVTARHRVAGAHEQQETDPVEQESDWKIEIIIKSLKLAPGAHDKEEYPTDNGGFLSRPVRVFVLKA